MVNTFEIIQICAMILAAAGTPGMTYLVMVRLYKQQIGHIAENCKICRKSLDDKIGGLDSEMGEVQSRQKTLRETELPDKYAKRRELEALDKKFDQGQEIIHKRIDRYHPAA